MRKVLFFLMLTLLTLFLAACDNGSPDLKVNTVSKANLTEREEVILSSTAAQSFVFDFNVEDKYKEVAVWVEKYKSGELVEEMNHISTGIKKRGTIIFTTSNMSEGSNQVLFTIGINSDGSTSTGWNPETITKVDDLQAVWGSNPLSDIAIKDKMVLASICYSGSKNGISSLSTDFYNDVEGHMNELKNYDVVYLLRSEFK
ncbi:hypothetical protein [Neobacillus kokaensis]|uniref:Lipoprotein n=1 Tax=Neobacillus kokaensis TaxID=2759023 RepID=A0ABQ3N676_9BACI|nr:hypothetical protein [Neobacillus kokaensis]GHI00431.1 hypothetical protein AM1BK_39730 [Neobacillus kokaensis]